VVEQITRTKQEYGDGRNWQNALAEIGSEWQKLAGGDLAPRNPLKSNETWSGSILPLKTTIYRLFSGACSVLRYVCPFARLREPSSPLFRPSYRVGRTCLPEPASPGRELFRVIAIALAFGAGSPCPGFEVARWESSGEFNLAGGFTAVSGWRLPDNKWSGGDAFERQRVIPKGWTPLPFHLDDQKTDIGQLLDLVATVEAGPDGYDAINGGAKILPADRPQNLTLGEIFAWIADTPGQQHAIGRYQFIPSTLEYLRGAEGIALSQRFTPALQDQMAARLIEDAGLEDYKQGKLGGSKFMDRLARIWAALPLENGQSAYAGIAGNRALMTRQKFESAFEEIFGRREP
jgi:hypothetical protein